MYHCVAWFKSQNSLKESIVCIFRVKQDSSKKGVAHRMSHMGKTTIKQEYTTPESIQTNTLTTKPRHIREITETEFHPHNMNREDMFRITKSWKSLVFFLKQDRKPSSFTGFLKCSSTHWHPSNISFSPCSSKTVSSFFLSGHLSTSWLLAHRPVTWTSLPPFISSSLHTFATYFPLAPISPM
jgi:hypothetical protein